jgi:glycerophosphoryl diester phosphodiesterase
MIELDVRLSADARLVVHHDAVLWRTTGVRRRIRDLPANEITVLDAGRWFGGRFRGAAVPDLASVLAWRPSWLGVNVEVKTDGDPRGGAAYVRPLLGLINRVPAGKLLVSSFDDGFLALLHRAAPRLALGCLYAPSRDRARGPVALARATGARVFICSAAQARPGLIGEARQGGLSVYVYGVRTMRQVDEVCVLDVGGVITDAPARIQRALNRRGCSL